MTQPAEQSADARVRRIASRMRVDDPHAYAVGWISSTVDDPQVTDADFRARVREALAALAQVVG